jgi:glucokinase
MRARAIGVDLGGTKILAGLVDRSGAVERHRETVTPLGSEAELLAGIDEAVIALLDDEVVALGVGVPSRIDRRTGRTLGSVNTPLGDLDLDKRMAERFGLPVTVENDATCAAYAEHVAGAGRGSQTMVMLTLGTGVGGGLVLRGKLFREWTEFGHMVVEYDGDPCFGACTGRGHLEAYASGTAATLRAQEAFGPAVDAHRLVRLADEGNEEAIEILDGIGRRLGAGIGTLVNIFDAELCVLGGGFAAAEEFLVPAALESARREALGESGERLRIIRSELGTMAGLVGAGLVGFDALDD